MLAKFEALLALLGLYVLLPKLCFILRFLMKLTKITKKRPLIEKYKPKGQDAPWALVTGCTAGIGEEITYRLAEDGFNVILVGRSAEKVQRVKEEVQRRSGGKAKTRPVIADLCKQAMDVQGYQAIA
jgi:hypothetical protein